MESSKATRHTLLTRACNAGDQQAWVEFEDRYRRFIRFILKQVGVARDEVDDVTQQILCTLTNHLPSYDRSKAKFRTWLGVIIRRAAFAHLRKQARHHIVMHSYGREQYFQDPGPGPGPSELDLCIENEWTTYIATLAMERARKVFKGEAIRVFELSLGGLTTAEISESTGLSVSSVYTLRKRVKKRLYLEVRAITAELEP